MLFRAIFTFVCCCLSAFGQGTILFQTDVPDFVDARIRDEQTGLVFNLTNPNWHVQLFKDNLNPASLEPLLPTTTFLSSGYVRPVVVTVPDVAPGEEIAVRVLAYFGPSYEKALAAVLFGEIYVTLGGSNTGPAPLMGLHDIVVANLPEGTIPEPSVLALLAFSLIFPSAKYFQKARVKN